MIKGRPATAAPGYTTVILERMAKMKLHLYTDYDGICTAPGEQFEAFAKSKAPGSAIFHIEVEHWQVAGKGRSVGSLMIVAKESSKKKPECPVCLDEKKIPATFSAMYWPERFPKEFKDCPRCTRS